MPLHRRMIEDEIVEDSEPEREAARQLQTNNGAVPNVRIYTKDIHEDSTRIMPSTSIIDLSGACFHSFRGQPKLTSNHLDDSLIESPPQSNREPLLDVKQGFEENNGHVIDISDSSMDPLQPANSNPQLTSGSNQLLLDLKDYDSELDNTLPELRLARFAHISARPAGPSKSKVTPSLAIRTMSTSVGSSRPAPTKKTAAQSLVQRLSDEFTVDSVSRLLVCVCCDLTWTTRKSVPQKFSHIRTCAKKHGIKDDTLINMVRKGIENAPVIQSKDKGKAVVSDVSAPKTFFDEVMNNAAPKKRTRRQEIPSTIRDIGQMRNAIMSRARTVVAKGNSNIRAFREHRISERFSDSDSSNGFLPSLTPRFGKSNLASRSSLQARPMFHENGECLEFSPSFSTPTPPLSPAVQPLLPSPASSLPGMDTEAHQVLMDTDAPNLETPFTPLKNKRSAFCTQSSHSPPPIYLSSSSNQITPNISKTLGAPNSPPFTPSPQKLTLLTSSLSHPTSSHSDEEIGQYGDDAYLHYEPDNDIRSSPIPNQFLFETSSPVRRSKKLTKSRSRSPTTLRRREKASTRERYVADETWVADLRKRILADTALHLRILRFEPIHFDVFLSKVGIQQPSAKVKLHLREFLDKQAINFYGAEPVGRRRR
ncbi:hypothetical protein DFH05DRAFT_1530306 [Lentinula detonsa]|uniref:Uncharacterized protein n=1 Tax=Lentinula detonsa TaxID=2804962 RepID=A0A9W8NRR2_9AGAR|nr:hypothetical protein DFH05DRAFT_1530306 [Lentinula detonsa]